MLTWHWKSAILMISFTLQSTLCYSITTIYMFANRVFPSLFCLLSLIPIFLLFHFLPRRRLCYFCCWCCCRRHVNPLPDVLRFSSSFSILNVLRFHFALSELIKFGFKNFHLAKRIYPELFENWEKLFVLHWCKALEPEWITVHCLVFII